jgi:hypothetical protein
MTREGGALQQEHHPLPRRLGKTLEKLTWGNQHRKEQTKADVASDKTSKQEIDASKA